MTRSTSGLSDSKVVAAARHASWVRAGSASSRGGPLVRTPLPGPATGSQVPEAVHVIVQDAPGSTASVHDARTGGGSASCTPGPSAPRPSAAGPSAAASSAAASSAALSAGAGSRATCVRRVTPSSPAQEKVTDPAASLISIGRSSPRAGRGYPRTSKMSARSASRPSEIVSSTAFVGMVGQGHAFVECLGDPALASHGDGLRRDHMAGRTDLRRRRQRRVGGSKDAPPGSPGIRCQDHGPLPVDPQDCHAQESRVAVVQPETSAVGRDIARLVAQEEDVSLLEHLDAAKIHRRDDGARPWGDEPGGARRPGLVSLLTSRPHPTRGYPRTRGISQTGCRHAGTITAPNVGMRLSHQAAADHARRGSDDDICATGHAH